MPRETNQENNFRDRQMRTDTFATPASTAIGILAACRVVCRACLVWLCLLGLMLSMVCCSDVENSLVAETPTEPMQARPINWSIQQGTISNTRALVDDNVLRQACTPNVYGNHASIGIWGQYTTAEDGQTRTYSVFNAEPLTYGTKAEYTNPYNDWNYLSETRLWVTNSQYDFRACYPQTLMTSLMTQMEPTIMQGGPINTSELQEDMLVAATHVDIQTEMPSGPVPLNMEHIFAALRFKVRAADGYTPPSGEAITSCWLQNKGMATNLFSPSGYLVHTGNVNPEIIWYTYESSSAPMYKWEHTGLSIATENILYTSNAGAAGKEYTQTDGWILVVPQQVHGGTLQFCYTMNSAGSYVFSVDIPAIKYEYGKRYTYILEINGASVDLKLTIADWNRLDSVHDIIM